MKQPTKNKISTPKPVKKVYKRKLFIKSASASEIDGSGLEAFFRINVLDVLGVKYDQQFEAKQFGRFYDFYLPDYQLIIECDGSFFHCDPRIYPKPINRMQRRNMRIDESKNKWALANGFKILRFWEKDIYSDTNKILNFLREKLMIQTSILNLNESKKNGTFFIKNN